MQHYVKFRPTSDARTTLISFTRALRRGVGTLVIAAAVTGTLMPCSAIAQSLFAPVARVNEDVITAFELEQRTRFLNLLSPQADAQTEARDALIEERLKSGELDRVGLSISDDEILQAMTEFAGRANMTVEQFISELANAGVEEQTFRDFAANGAGWRQYVSARFLSQARPSEEDIDRAMGTASNGAVQVLLSEIILPLDPSDPAQQAQVQELAKQISELKSPAAFTATATQFSASQSRLKGGDLGWLPLNRLPGPLQEVVLELSTNQITDPLPLQGAIAIFQLRGLREVLGRDQTLAAIDYATYRIPGGHAASTTALEIREEIDTCDDLYGINKGQSEELLFRGSRAPNEIDSDIAVELAKLDPNESSAVLTRDNGDTLLLVMLCGRTAEINTEADDARAKIANALTQKRLNDLSDSFVEQLKANARISYE